MSVRAFRRPLLSLLLSVSFSGCGQTESEIQGEVFLLMENGETRRMPLVEIYAYSEKDVTDYINRKASIDSKERSDLDKKVEDVKKICIEKNESLYEVSHNMFTEALRKRSECKSNTRRREECAAAFEEANTRSDYLLERYTRIRDECIQSSEAYMARARYEDPDYVWAEFSATPVGVSKSDSDGKFSMRLQGTNQKVAILARPTITARDSLSEKRWRIWATPSDFKNTMLMLSNDNLDGTQCKSCVRYFSN